MEQGTEQAAPSGQLGNSANEFLQQHRHIFERYTPLKVAADIAENAPEKIAELNRMIDRDTQALYAEIRAGSTPDLYVFNSDAQTWEVLGGVSFAGDRPFIGDTFIIVEDGERLLVADTARGVGIGEYGRVEIRTKDDPIVQEFAAEESVDRLRKVGEAAMEQGRPGLIAPGRWGQESTDPPVE